MTAIDDAAFCGGICPTSVTIPRSVTRIGTLAFSDCKDLVNVTFEEESSPKSVGSSAFEDCNCLESIVLSTSLTSIESNTFYTYSNLEVSENGIRWNDIDAFLLIPSK